MQLSNKTCKSPRLECRHQPLGGAKHKDRPAQTPTGLR